MTKTDQVITKNVLMQTKFSQVMTKNVLLLTKFYQVMTKIDQHPMGKYMQTCKNMFGRDKF